MSKGRFGFHGGQFVPEALMNAVNEFEEAYFKYKDDPEFVAELDFLMREYAGRPSRLYYAEKMTKDLGGAKIHLKREDLNHTGSHKLNNCLGQCLLAKKMGKTRVIAETGVTGVKGEIIAGLEETMRVVREVCDSPCAIGIGNPSVEEAVEAAKASDGVIIGAQVVSIVAKYGKDSIEPVVEYIKNIKNAVK